MSNFTIVPVPDFVPKIHPRHQKINWEERIAAMTKPVWYLIGEYEGVATAGCYASRLRKQFPAVTFSIQKSEPGQKPFSRIYAKK